MDRRTWKSLEHRGRTREKHSLLKCVEEYEVAEKASQADLETAETILAHLLVQEWLRVQGGLTEDARIGHNAPNRPDLPEDDDGS